MEILRSEYLGGLLLYLLHSDTIVIQTNLNT